MSQGGRAQVGVSVQARGVTARTPAGRILLGPIDLELAPGEVVSIVGPSGAGKSTLLRIVAGLQLQAEGTVSVAGARNPARVGLAPQSPALLPWLTVAQNTRLPGSLQADGARAENATALLERFGLSASAELRPSQLSGGMQSRVALARALACEPDLLLLDEPFGSLDEVTAEDILVQLAQLIAQRGCTTLLVSHNLHQAAFLSDRIVVFSAAPGRIEADIRIERRGGRDRAALDDPGVAAAVAATRAALRGRGA